MDTIDEIVTVDADSNWWPTAADLSFVRSVVRDESGLDPGTWGDAQIASRLKRAMTELGMTSNHELTAALGAGHPAAVDAVVDHLLPTATSFFADRHALETIADVLVPALVSDVGGEPITVWCAGCSSGQEPFSLAMLLSEHHPDLVAAGRVRVLGTDVSTAMIQRCLAGRYSQFEVDRGLPTPMRVRYFSRDDQEWTVNPELRRLVEFRQHNLIGSWEAIPRCDVVVLRHVLTHLDADQQHRVLERMRTEALNPGGVLVIGADEPVVGPDGFDRDQHGRTIVFRIPVDQP